MAQTLPAGKDGFGSEETISIIPWDIIKLTN